MKIHKTRGKTLNQFLVCCRKYGIFLCLFELVACRDMSTPTISASNGSEIANDASNNQRVTMPPTPEEAALIEQIVALAPPRFRDPIRKSLSARVGGSGSVNPQMDTLMKRLNVMRAERYEREQRPGRERMEALMRATARIGIALSDDLGGDDIRAVVLRRTGDDGMPILLLRSRDFTETDMAFGVQMAIRALEEDGDNPTKDRRRVYRQVGDGVLRSSRWHTEASRLRQAAPQEVPGGLGSLRAIVVYAKKPSHPTYGK